MILGYPKLSRPSLYDLALRSYMPYFPLATLYTILEGSQDTMV